jgi:hypothetical protein
MTSMTIPIWRSTSRNVRLLQPKLTLQKCATPHTSALTQEACSAAGCGLLHPRTSVSQGYDFLQMMFLWYIVAMVPVSANTRQPLHEFAAREFGRCTNARIPPCARAN